MGACACVLVVGTDCVHKSLCTCEGLVYFSMNLSVSTGVDNVYGEKVAPKINNSREPWDKKRDGRPQGTRVGKRMKLLTQWAKAVEGCSLSFPSPRCANSALSAH